MSHLQQDSILKIKDVTKRFVNVLALDSVTFEIQRGTITGLLGPNGAGKTTLLRIINNILVPDSGEVLIDGHKASFETGKWLGYMPEERGLYDNMRIEDQILYFGQLKGKSQRELRPVMKEYLELFNLTDSKKRRIKELSKGNQQKVQIVATLVHKPELVILDEPFSGFDPINGQLLQDLIHRLHEEGTTIILSSHNMAAVEDMCSHIALINNGRLLLQGAIDDLKEQHRDDSLILTTRTPLKPELLNGAREVIPTDTPHHRKGFSYLVHTEPGISNADLIHAASAQSEIVHFEEKLPTLQDLFLRYTTSK